MFPSSGDGRKTPTLLGPLERADLTTVGGVLRPSHEDGNRPSFWNVLFSSYLEFQTMDKVQNPSNSEYYTIVRTLWILYDQ
jgi:hypothetical protein